ncbi:centromere protein T [Corythoichthys intestinalis]|uniref:centromere protein T n=1 Tax=Corythoichthys intestinalis TaxID=161448 RepID=UPI0025A5C08C|nr:centromere protein T [Corythoichthys intestinalis]XP_061807764.1 centromere protein T-like [Nerophis lumbriciformis]
MDPTDDLTARSLLSHIVSREQPRSPITRSVSKRQKSKGAAAARKGRPQTPQNILKNKMERKLRERISGQFLPTPTGRSASPVGKKQISALSFDENDSPRKLLMNILQTEPAKSPLAGFEPQPSSADASMTTKHPSPDLSESELSELDLPNVTYNVTSVAKGLTRKGPRRSMNVTAFEARVEKGLDYAENEDDNSAQQDLSNSTNLSLRTPFVGDQTQKIGLRRRVSYHQRITENDFDDAVNKMCQEQGVSSFTQSEPSLGNTAHAETGLEYTMDIINCHTALYAQTDTAEIPMPATQDNRVPEQAELESGEEHCMEVASGIEEAAEMTSEEEEKVESEVETKTEEEEEQDTAEDEDDDDDGRQGDDDDEVEARNQTTERIEWRAHHSEGAVVMPVPNSAPRSRNLELTPDTRPEQEEVAEEPDGRDAKSFHLLEVSEGESVGDSNQLEEAEVQEEEDDDDDDEQELEETPINTPTFVRERRKTFQRPYPISRTLFNPQPGTSSSEGVPPAKAKQARKPKSGAQQKRNSGLPKSYLMTTFRHFAKTKVSRDVYPILEDTMDKFFDRMADDLETFAAHAGRKTIEVEDCELLLRRQGHVNDKVPVEVLIERYLRMDQRRMLIPVATSGNVVFPKMKKR